MLARGLVCRLAADVPKTSTHDLPQLARLVQRQRFLPTRNGLSIRSFGALSRTRRVFTVSRRCYATTVRATKPTATVKKAVKKEAAKKPAPKKKATAKKAAKPKKKAAPKKKAPAKPKKVLTPEEKEKATIKQLRVTALKEPVPQKTISTHAVFIGEGLKGRKDIQAAMKEAQAKWKSLSSAELEHYNHLANERNATQKAQYDAWVRSYTPDQIRLANNARSQLRKLLQGKTKSRPANTVKIQDDRQYKRPLVPLMHFTKDRWASGDLKGIKTAEGARLISDEWKALSAGEKQKYIDLYEADKAAKAADFERIYGHKA